jgi:hypothetical protein
MGCNGTVDNLSCGVVSSVTTWLLLSKSHVSVQQRNEDDARYFLFLLFNE